VNFQAWIKLAWFYLLGIWCLTVLLALGINLYEWWHQTPFGTSRPLWKTLGLLAIAGGIPPLLIWTAWTGLLWLIKRFRS
jgi:hypothetical protein